MATFPVSDYPGAVDSDIPVPSDGDTITSDWGKGVRNAIVATQTELGVDPAGSEATVAARLAAIEAENTAQGVDLAAVEADVARVSENVFHVDDFGAVGNGTTDDTAAFLAARDALVTAGGGTIQLGAKTYLLDGSLLTNRNGYAILPLPTGRTPITIRGVQPANNCDPRTDGGKYSIVKVTKTGLSRSGTYGVPSVIGGPTDSTWAENTVTLRDFCLWLPANPTIAGVDLWHVRRFIWDGVIVQAINTGDTDYTNPTSVYAFGVRTPEPLNYNACLMRNGQVHGMYAGLVGSVESLVVEYFVAKWCKVGWGVAPGGHGAAVLKMDLSWCPYSISGWSETAGATSVQTGALGETTAQVSIKYLAIEDWAGSSKWYDPIYTLNDSTNRVKGVGFFDYYHMVTGIGSTFTKNGGTGFTAISLLSPSFGGGGSALTVQDENSNVSTSVTQIDFQGAGVTATSGSGEVVVTIPGVSATRFELVMQDGVTAPPVPLETEARDDWLYTD